MRKTVKYCTLLLLLISSGNQAEIYKWVDERGVTHYGEKQPDNQSGAKEISDSLEQKTNIIKFVKTKPIKFYQPKATRRSIKLNIELHTIKFDLSEDLRQRIEDNVNAIFRVYVHYFGWNPTPRRPIVIHIFGKYKDFEDYQIANRGRFYTNRSHYSPQHQEVLMLGSEFSQATLAVLLHESSHAIMDLEARYTPKWINEGLAEVFELTRANRQDIRLDYNAAWSEIIKHKLREGSLRPLSEYMAISNREWHQESGRVERTYYMIAWAMMRFLIGEERGRPVLRQALLACKRRACQGKTSLSNLFERFYPGGMDDLDSDLREWIVKLP